MRRFIRFAALAVLFAAAPASVRAENNTVNMTEEVLDVSGALSKGAPLHLSLADIERMPKAKLATTTPWHTGRVEFEGVLVKDFLAAIGATGAKLVVTALNNYACEIPIQDLVKYGAILAYKRDGNYMPIRDKGPLFIVFPYDSNPVLATEKFYSNSPWQIASIVVR